MASIYDNARIIVSDLFDTLEKKLEDLFKHDNLKRLFEKQFPAYKETIRIHKDRLQEICPLVVVGETSCGKSSFLNLILEAHVLPVEHQYSTAGIIKIQKGEYLTVMTSENKKTVYRDVKGKDDAAEIVCKHLEGIITSKTGDDEEQLNKKCTEVTIVWPFECTFLQDGVTIVDTPGYGGNEDLNSLLMKYIHKAVAFLYIINAGNAGGIQSDRLKKIIRAQYKYCEDNDIERHMDTRRALFFLNKWDQIDPYPKQRIFSMKKSERSTPTGENQSKVWSSTIDVLKKLWVGFQIDQAMKFSIHEIRGHLRDPCIGLDEDHGEKALAKIAAVAKNSLECGLDPSKAWLSVVSNFLLRTFVSYIITAGANVEEKEKIVEEFESLKEKVTQLNDKQMVKMKTKLTEKADILSKLVLDHISSVRFKEEMHNWEANDIELSLITNTKEEIESSVKRVVIERFSSVIRIQLSNEFDCFALELKDILYQEAEIVLSHLNKMFDKFKVKDTSLIDAGALLTKFTMIDVWSSSFSFNLSLNLSLNTVFNNLIEHRLARFFQLILRVNSKKIDILTKASNNAVENVSKTDLQDDIKKALKENVESAIDTFSLHIVPQTISSLAVQCNDIKNSKDTEESTLNKYKGLMNSWKTFFESCKKLSSTQNVPGQSLLAM